MAVPAAQGGSRSNRTRRGRKRPPLLLGVVALSLFLFSTAFWGSRQSANGSSVSPPTAVEVPRCAILSFDGCNPDIWAGLAYAWQSAGCLVDIYSPSSAGVGICKEYRGMFQTLMESWFNGSWLHMEAIYKRAPEYSVLGIVPFPISQIETVGNPALEFEAYLAEQLNTSRFDNVKFYAEVNNPRWLRRPRRLALVNGLRRQLFMDTLSPPFSLYTDELLQQSGVQLARPTGFFTPAMPLSEGLNRKIEAYASGALNASNLCVQGILDPTRRNYREVFNVVEAVKDIMIATDQKLLLVGSNVSMLSAAVIVPEGLRPLVLKAPNLGTEEFYGVLMSCRAVFTAFSREDYYISKSSSTVSAALNLGVPLITDTRTMGMYPFLSPKSVFLFEPPTSKRHWESYVQAARAALTAGTSQRRAMLRTKAQMAEHNKAAAEQLLWA